MSQAPAARADDGGLAKALANPLASLISVPLQFDTNHGFGTEDGDQLKLTTVWRVRWADPLRFELALERGDAQVLRADVSLDVDQRRRVRGRAVAALLLGFALGCSPAL